MNIVAREELERIPCDKMFYFGGNMTFWHATGYEVCIEICGEKSWWKEYVSPDGETYEYGR